MAFDWTLDTTIHEKFEELKQHVADLEEQVGSAQGNQDNVTLFRQAIGDLARRVSDIERQLGNSAYASAPSALVTSPPAPASPDTGV